MLRETLNEEGYAFLEKYRPRYTALEVASEIGNIAVLSGIRPSQRLTPNSKTEHEPNTYSGNYGFSEFPLHSDLAHWFLPPRYLLLRCIKGTASVSTRIYDSKNIVSEFGEVALTRTLVRPRRPVNCAGYLLKIFEKKADGHNLFRWDEKFITPASDKSSIIIPEILHKIKAVVFQEVFLVSPGDTLIIDNWRMLHGRSSVPTEGLSRHIERVYLENIK